MYVCVGGKGTLWEGGTRVIGMLKGAGLREVNLVQPQLVHVSDWLPTLVSMAVQAKEEQGAGSGKDWRSVVPAGEPEYLEGDGVNLWDVLSSAPGTPAAARDYIILETHTEVAEDRIHGDAFLLQYKGTRSRCVSKRAYVM